MKNIKNLRKHILYWFLAFLILSSIWTYILNSVLKGMLFISVLNIAIIGFIGINVILSKVTGSKYIKAIYPSVIYIIPLIYIFEDIYFDIGLIIYSFLFLVFYFLSLFSMKVFSVKETV